MKIKNIFITTIAVLTLSACSTQNIPVQVPQPTDTPQPSAQSDTEINKGTFQDLVNRGTSVCTYSYKDETTTSTGTVYIHNKQMRGDTVSTVDGSQINGSLIIKDDTMYTWTTNPKQGVKFSLSEIQEMSKDHTTGMSPEIENKTLDSINQEYDYDCKNWTPDQTKFTIPTDITFMDMSKQIEQLNSMHQDMGSNNCSICNNLTGDQEAQCKQALKCTE